MIPQNLTNIRELDPEILIEYLKLAKLIQKSPADYASCLKGKSVLQFFAENSTRTRMSFEAATRKLGGTSIGFSAVSSSQSKGETLLDTVLAIKQYGIDAIVMRHLSARSPELVSKATGISVINAGDGSHEHPTQALTDAFVLAAHWGIKFEETKPFAKKTLLILGDSLHSRVARSNIHLFTKLGARVMLCGPRTLRIKNLELFPKVEVFNFPESCLKDADAVMPLRIQFERQNQGLIPSKEEYRHFWGLTPERSQMLKKNASILHPGPINRGVEIDSEIADSSASLILKQVEAGVFVRMAVLGKLIGGLCT